MIQRKSLIAVAIAAALVAPAALAQTGGMQKDKSPAYGSEGSASTRQQAPGGAARNPTDRTSNMGGGTFTSFDTNRDGFVSRDEAKNSGELNRQFRQLDKDNDGKLSSQELSGWQGSPGTASSAMGEGKVGASGSSGVGSSSEPSGGIRDSGKAPPSSNR